MGKAAVHNTLRSSYTVKRGIEYSSRFHSTLSFNLYFLEYWSVSSLDGPLSDIRNLYL